MNIQSSRTQETKTAGESIEEMIIRMSAQAVEPMPVLETIFRRFSVALPAVLDRYSGAETETSFESISYSLCGEALASLPAPGFYAMGRVSPGAKPFMVSIEPELLITSLEVMLGGRGSRRKQWSPREFTAIEKKLGARLCETILGELAANFAEIGQIAFSIEAIETAQDAAALVLPAAEPASHVEMKVSISGQEGGLAFIFPHSSFDALRPRLTQKFWGAAGAGDANWTGLLNEKIQETSVGLTAVLHDFAVPMSKVLGWKTGATLDLGIDGDHEVTLHCSGVPMFHAAMGRRKNGSVALRVTEELKAKDRLNDDGTVD